MRRRISFISINFQSELFPEGKRRVVILSQVLPANSTIGYDDFSYLVVKKVNGKGDALVSRSGRGGEDAAQRFQRHRDAWTTRSSSSSTPPQVAAEADALQKNYGLPALQRLP